MWHRWGARLAVLAVTVHGALMWYHVGLSACLEWQWEHGLVNHLAGPLAWFVLCVLTGLAYEKIRRRYWVRPLFPFPSPILLHLPHHRFVSGHLSIAPPTPTPHQFWNLFFHPHP